MTWISKRSILASLHSSSSCPLTSLSLSPDGTSAAVCGRDALRILHLTGHSTKTPSLEELHSIRLSQPTPSHRYPHIHDVLGSSPAPSNVNVTITDVAWSLPQSYTVDFTHSDTDHDDHPGHYPPFLKRHRDPLQHDSILVAARSNGVVAAYSASHPTTPEAVFSAHSRAVNRLAWHCTGHRPYLLLTASQDATAKLWDRRASSSTPAPARGWWFDRTGPTAVRTANWHCVATYAPKCEAVRDIGWSPLLEEVFAMVTDNGTLCVYDIRVNRPLIKVSAHAGDATSVDWHPRERYTVATGGGRDRSVKVWDVEHGLNIHKQDESMSHFYTNSLSYLSDYTSESLTNASCTSSDKFEDGDAGASHGGRTTPNPINSNTIGSLSSGSPNKRPTAASAMHPRHHKQNLPIHVLSISSPVTRIRWRPTNTLTDPPIAVATSPISGANAGGHGHVGLWTCTRQFYPMSIVEGHSDGAVVDFAFVDCFNLEEQGVEDSSAGVPLESTGRYEGRGREDGTILRSVILSIGRDGQCLLQDFSLGERPHLQVPHSTFALANLSAFQPGYGSLQIMATHQNVDAFGVLRMTTNATLPVSKSELVFSVTDQGYAEDLTTRSLREYVDVAPELTHLSRFSELYETSTGSRYTTKAEVCRHNASVADGLDRKALANMWTTMSIILEGSDSGGHSVGSRQSTLEYLLIPTLQQLLIQRADAGDVQTCVVLCEVMDVIASSVEPGGAVKSALPNIDIEGIREWYLSYIDLLQQMCLFTQAANLIRNCSDPVIGALNQQSTTISESCPLCNKPLTTGATVEDHASGSRHNMSQRVCRSCRGRIGLCCLCHEPVKGMFVWCPGCGHGGHLDHALEWFGTNEVCPTGCGHRCNIFPERRLDKTL